MQLQPYLMFDGRCEEAAKFYEKALGAKIEKVVRFKDSPDPGMCPGPDGEKVMHMSLRIGDQALLASDGQCGGKPSFQGFSLSLNVPNEAEANRLFAALSNGGQVQTLAGEPVEWHPPVYLSLLQSTIEDALRFGASRLSLGRTALEPKAKMGCKPEPLACAARHRVSAVNGLVSALTRGASHDEPPERSPFKQVAPTE